MGRELVERAGLGPRASVSAAVARTGPQARASSSNGRRTKKLRAVDEGRFEEKLSQQVMRAHFSCCCRCVRTTLGKGYLRTSGTTHQEETGRVRNTRNLGC